MRHLSLGTIAGFICIIAVSCSQTSSTTRPSSFADPFVGYFATQSGGNLELKPVGDNQYAGTLWIDSQACPVELTRDGNMARGVFHYDEEKHQLWIEDAPQGLMLIIDDICAETAMQRYESRQAYEKSLKEFSDSQAGGDATGPAK